MFEVVFLCVFYQAACFLISVFSYLENDLPAVICSKYRKIRNPLLLTLNYMRPIFSNTFPVLLFCFCLHRIFFLRESQRYNSKSRINTNSLHIWQPQTKTGKPRHFYNWNIREHTSIADLFIFYVYTYYSFTTIIGY